MTNAQIFFDNLPLFIPLIILELGLMISAVISIFKHTRYRLLNRWLWLVIVVCLQLVGPLLYFLFGKEEA
ncbi:PLD nuclease N-terminal domain-containing protein [Enterococcus bulliens]|uniref:PLD nuclease N-terminal domain-containing protein n=1 Tax=uncultured Enterococcus sp. TaxID=167972 RepID=UPI0025F65A8D|nr:PLD nuclease N-terminal domain-containing protein [uncultured Enterococcus sp.]